MKSFCAAALAAAICVGFYIRPAAQPARPALTIEQLIDIRHPSAPMWAPDGRHVVFVWERAGVAGIYVADAPISNSAVSRPRELTEAGSQLPGAFWSSDGIALMIPRGGELRRVPIDGSAASTVWKSANATNIVASPDGKHLAFVSGKEIRVVALGDARELVVARDDRAISGLGWSPDGQHLVFTAGAHTVRHEQTPQYSGSKIIYTITENVPRGIIVTSCF